MLSSFELAGHVIGVILNKDLTKEIVHEITQKIDEKLEIYESINVFIELEKGHHISFRGFVNGLNFKFQNSDRLDKVAIVTDSFWFKKSVDMSDIFLAIDVRTFDLKDRIEAIQWISQ